MKSIPRDHFAFLLLATMFAGCAPQKNISSVSSLVSSRDFQKASLGAFEVTWNSSTEILTIFHKNAPQRPLWKSSAGKNFLAAAADNTKFEQVRGSITTHESFESPCNKATIQTFASTTNTLAVQGRLEGNCQPREFSLVFKPEDDRRLGFEIKVTPNNGKRLRTILRYESAPNEGYFGFGEQFSEFNMKGKRLPLLVQEQGHGRGLQPLSMAINLASKGSAGSWHTTYAPVPQYITSLNRGFYLSNYEPATFDFTKPTEAQVEVLSDTVRGGILYGESPLDLISAYTNFSGRMRPLPEWVQRGAIVGLQGGETFVRETIAKLEAQRVPISAVWLQDWVGQRSTTAGERLWWNWEVDHRSYPNWNNLVSDLKNRGYRVLGYVNPFLSDTSSNAGSRKNYYLEAKQKDYLIKRPDGSVVMVDTAGFSGALVDFSNPQARSWLKNIIKQSMVASGLSGWMADFGEAVPLDSAPQSKENPLQFHSRYVEEWAKLNQEIMAESGLETEGLFFVRSGYSRSPGLAHLFWVGDQMVSWDEHDGIKTTVMAMMSSGISGFSLNHSDIGGCIALTIPGLTFKRSNELLHRWMELNAFTPVFRTHEGTNPVKGGAQAYDSEENIKWLRYYSSVYATLAEYRKIVAQEASQKGWPMIRAPFLHYPNDPNIFSNRYQFLLGKDVLVAPVLDPGKTSQQVYLPAGKWTHIWTNHSYGNELLGSTVSVAAPIGKPAVFFRSESKVLQEALLNIRNIPHPIFP